MIAEYCRDAAGAGNHRGTTPTHPGDILFPLKTVADLSNRSRHCIFNGRPDPTPRGTGFSEEPMKNVRLGQIQDGRVHPPLGIQF